MEAKDLMIGDLVLYVDKEGGIETPCRINSLNLNGEWTAQILNSEFIFQGDNTECSIEECLLPIPITPEILKKNWFEYYEPYDPEIKTEGYKSNDNRIFIRREKTSKSDWFCVIYTEGIMEELMLGISYVHELQHALKLCKIEKEIVL